MASTSLHKVSSSHHPFFREALRCVDLFVTVAQSYAALVFAGAMDLLLGPLPIPGFQGEPIERHGYGGKKQHAGALGLITASVMSLLVAMLVSLKMNNWLYCILPTAVLSMTVSFECVPIDRWNRHILEALS